MGGGSRHLFLLTLYKSKNIGVGRCPPPPVPLLCGPCSYSHFKMADCLGSLNILLSCKYGNKVESILLLFLRNELSKNCGHIKIQLNFGKWLGWLGRGPRFKTRYACCSSFSFNFFSFFFFSFLLFLFAFFSFFSFFFCCSSLSFFYFFVFFYSVRKYMRSVLNFVNLATENCLNIYYVCLTKILLKLVQNTFMTFVNL